MMTSTVSEVLAYLITILSGIVFFIAVAVAVRTKDRHTRKMALVFSWFFAAFAMLGSGFLVSMKDRQNKPPSSPSPPPKKTISKALKIVIIGMAILMLIAVAFVLFTTGTLGPQQYQRY